MIVLECSSDAVWPTGDDWTGLADAAVRAAFAVSPHADWLDRERELSVSVHFGTDKEVHSLNRGYRGKDKPTNVLSFPMTEPGDLEASEGASPLPELLLGDIILAQQTCAREARDKGVTLAEHATHLVVHGTLHLLGYDHKDDDAAAEMEALEAKALAKLGIANPYGGQD